MQPYKVEMKYNCSSPDGIAVDILKKELYIGILDKEIASVYVLNDECDEQYKNGNWKYPDASYKIVHRLCVDPRFQNRGVGRETVKHIE